MALWSHGGDWSGKRERVRAIRWQDLKRIGSLKDRARPRLALL